MTSLSFGTRLWFAWACFFRVLFDGAFAARAFAAREPRLLAPVPNDEPEPPTKPEKTSIPKVVAVTPAAPPASVAPSLDAALQLLALFQREGRFIDFLEEDVAGFTDSEVGAAARVVHEGCRKALRGHGTISAVRSEEEGAKVEVGKGTPPSQVKLVGNVKGEPPFRGVLLHRGWRIDDLSLPTAAAGHDSRYVAPAEVEL